jgi:hypothetical protein
LSPDVVTSRATTKLSSKHRLAPASLHLLNVLLLVACIPFDADAASRLPQDVYVWQRVWTPALASALNASSDLIREWRVLTAESDLRGRLRPMAVNWGSLASTRRPVITVVRIDGQLANWSEDQLLAEIRVLASSWRKSGAMIEGIEIDYDCGTARLAAYAHFLARLHAEPGMARRLSVTALPAWMESPDFDSILAATDEVVLQVHAVRAPRLGLFDGDLAWRWIDALDRRTTKPFRVALPDYSARVVQSGNGRILAVESEVPKMAGGASETELVAAPRQVSQLLRGLEHAPPVHLAGIVWFRLPTAADTQTWSLSTWRAVIAGMDLSAKLEVAARPGSTPQMADIVLQNPGDIDASLPSAVDLPRGCALADGINGYGLRETRHGISLERLQSGLLYAHHAQVIGWMRCPAAGASFHVRP